MEKYGFEKLKVIGKGAFGSAILVRNAADGKKYVAKEVNLFRMKREEREEAKNEIKVLSKLNHPNIVRYLTHFEENSMLYIVMEYADGGDLDSRIKAQRGQPFKEDAIMHYFVQVCMALKHLHDRKTLHRDLKGQNIFLTSTNVVKLGDFGISTILMNTNAQARTMCGTPYYFSPELCQNRPYNNKSDVWSLGCILYELTTLKHAFEGQNMKGLLQKIVRGNYPPVSPGYSVDLRTLIDSMLQRDPGDRPSVNAILRLPFVQARIQQICGSDPAPPPRGTAVDDMAAELVRRREEGMRERLQREKERKELELRAQQERQAAENERQQRERREQQERLAQAEVDRKQRAEREAKRREELLQEAEERRRRDAARLLAESREREAERERQIKLRAEREKERKQREARDKEVQRKRELQWQGLGADVLEGAEATPIGACQADRFCLSRQTPSARTTTRTRRSSRPSPCSPRSMSASCPSSCSSSSARTRSTSAPTVAVSPAAPRTRPVLAFPSLRSQCPSPQTPGHSCPLRHRLPVDPSSFDFGATSL